jgi:glycosyltransferase involved in cell wall biosynthesis
MKKTCILMATYNGVPYLPIQLQSIQKQTYQDWVLIVRDDNSNDDTPNLLQQYAQQDNRIKIVSDDKGNLGSTQNFARLMELAQKQHFHYIAFADQDDYWLSEKLTLQLAQIQQLEKEHGDTMPIMVYSDLAVVDEQLTLIHPSFQQYQGIQHVADFPLSLLIGQNLATGCGMLVNYALLEKCLPLPNEAVVHDWWISLIIAALGKVGYIEKPLTYYRQHAANQIGVVKIDPSILFDKVACTAFLTKNTKNFLDCLNQARALATHLRALEKNEVADYAESYATLLQKPLFERINTLFHYEFCKQGLLRRLAFYFRVLVLNKFLLNRLSPKI